MLGRGAMADGSWLLAMVNPATITIRHDHQPSAMASSELSHDDAV
jgi:hypothetical protein